MRKTTYNDIRKPECRTRTYTAVDIAAALDGLGRGTQLRVRITCPFCYSDVVAYVWSLSGGGKRCPYCGALFSSGNRAYRMPEK